MITKPSELIIHRPGAQTAEGKLIAWLLSLGLWWRLARLVRVFLAAVGWGTAWVASSAIAGRMHATAVLRASTLIYLPAVLGLVVLLWGWALYNWLRFHGRRDKRCHPPSPLSLETASKAFRLPQALLQQAKEAKVDICHFDDKGNLQAIDCCISVSEAERRLRRLSPPRAAP